MNPKRIVKDEAAMLILWDGYKKHIADNPRIKVEYVGRDGERVNTPLRIPLTLEGFRVHCYNTVGCVYQYFVNQDGLYDEYITICTRIKNEIRQDQIEGGMVGQYNASITQRLNNLKETTENTNINHNQPLINLDPLDDSADNGTA
tara:strand:- start:51 stop:488 length:438 start_codon:yes stop_codon:yes gene_type:complete